MLRHNDDKTELMFVISKRNNHLHNLPTSITIGNAHIQNNEYRNIATDNTSNRDMHSMRKSKKWLGHVERIGNNVLPKPL